jgi:hypothetical protein
MSKELKPGMWCRTSPEERSAILALAKALEVGGFEDRSLSICPNIGVVSVGKTSVEATAWIEKGEPGYPKVSIPDFIAAMYAEAERRKENKGAPRMFTYDGNKWVDPLAALTRRVEELERAEKDQHQRLFEKMMNGAVTPEFVRECADRHFSRLKESKPLVDPAIIERQVGVILRLKSVSNGNDHHCYIDPDASPSGVPFEVALMYLKQGRNAMRLGQYHRIEPRGIGAVGGLRKVAGASHDIGPFDPSCADMCASDWCVLPKEQKA